jgi:hypothetical protein
MGGHCAVIPDRANYDDVTAGSTNAGAQASERAVNGLVFLLACTRCWGGRLAQYTACETSAYTLLVNIGECL